MGCSMDYSRIYIELMERASDRVIDGYTEKHHIVPKCMGGDNKPRNIAVLTPEEHFLAHQLLVKIYPNNSKLVYACKAMSMSNNGLRGSMKLYGWLRRKESINTSKRLIGNNHCVGYKHSVETRKKQSLSHIGNKYGVGYKHSMDSRRKISESLKGKLHSEERKLNGSRSVEKYSNDGIFLDLYESIKDASKHSDVGSNVICMCCKGKQKTAGGYIWKYKDYENIN